MFLDLEHLTCCDLSKKYRHFVDNAINDMVAHVELCSGRQRKREKSLDKSIVNAGKYRSMWRETLMKAVAQRNTPEAIYTVERIG